MTEWVDYVSVGIALVSLVISGIVAWTNKKTLVVEISKNAEVIKPQHIMIMEEDGPLPYGSALKARLEIVNPSNKDIAFFDMRAFDPQTNINGDLLTRRAVYHDHREKPIYEVIPTSNESTRLTELYIPDKNHGIIKSNSFIILDLVMFPREDQKELGFSVKFSMRKPWTKPKDRFAVTKRKKFHYEGIVYHLEKWPQLDTKE
ncbi:hypothetical protein [uncultured Marinococcus sp.]|uniref:hypothetical protein n=1 Tax=uncultured Marinococcus sp. TaxID=487012 RepID=UPI0026047AB9|nr:hypothetical protein [uncultured Marinococcus sp.]